MVAATGPFTTSDNLDMGALRDLMDIVKLEKPDLLVLVRKIVNICERERDIKRPLITFIYIFSKFLAWSFC